MQLLNTAEAGAALGAEVSTARWLPRFRPKGGSAEGARSREHPLRIPGVPLGARPLPARTPAPPAKPRDSTRPSRSAASDKLVPRFQPDRCHLHTFLPHACAACTSILFTVFHFLSGVLSG